MLPTSHDLAAALSGAFAQAAAEPPPGGGLASMLPMLAMFGLVFYFIVLRPQRAEQNKREAMLNAVAKGDRIVTIGGLHAVVETVHVGDNTVTILLAPKLTPVKINRSAIAAVTPRKGKEGEKASDDAAPAAESEEAPESQSALDKPAPKNGAKGKSGKGK